MTFEQLAAIATAIGTLVSIVVAIAAFLHARQVDTERFAKLELMVTTLWNLFLQKAGSDMVIKGMATLQSPLEINSPAFHWFDGMRHELQEFYCKRFKCGSDADLAIAIQLNYGARLLTEISIPSGMALEKCLVIASAVAKSGTSFELPDVPLDSNGSISTSTVANTGTSTPPKTP